VLCDLNGQITFANRAAELLFSAARNDIIGQTYNGGKWKITDVKGEPLPENELPFERVLSSQESVSGIEHAVQQVSGKVVIVSVNAAPLKNEAGDLGGAVLSITDITTRKAFEDRLSFQAFHDPLTKLPNRALFLDRLGHAMIRAARAQTSVAVFFLDLDNFKKTNDTLGHDAGDELLKSTANRVLESLRSSDTAARLGGDEFTVLLENITELDQALVVADRMLQALLQPVAIKGENVYAPPSIGIAMSTLGCTPDDMMNWADAAMYQAKKNGKSRYEIYVPSEETATEEVVST
jgi:diguanylate cyclase (GGDEF)-like protein/PAS domain S-box-containing protein